MTVRIEKPAINVREELADLRKPSGVAGEAMLRAETPQEQFNLIGAGRRNLIINGGMQVAQRGTSFTPAFGTSTYTLDRFVFYQSSGTIGVDQATDSPDGFEYSLKCEVDATGNVANGTIVQVGQPIEGYNLAPLDWNGGSNAQPATASFWVKSSETGVYGFRIRLGGVGTIIKEFTINSSNTWEHKTVSIPACPYTIPHKTNGSGLFMGVQLVSGSSYYAASDGVWQTADAYGTSGMNNNWITTSGATFKITGVQLELGKVATPFEHRSYGEELAACQRYYSQIYYQYEGTIGLVGNVAPYSPVLPVTMRAAGTITHTNVANGGNVSGLHSSSVQSANSLNTVFIVIYTNGTGYGYYLADIAIDAEL